MRRWYWVLFVLPAGLALAQSSAEEDDLKLLATAHVGTDGPGLVRYFRQRVVGQTERNEINALIRKLGDDSYPVRERATDELINKGLPAIGLLKPVAAGDPDWEIRRRAERCLKAIEQVPSTSIAAAVARVMARQKPDGGVEALLAYLPMADDDMVADEIRHALAALANQNGQPHSALLQALESKNAIVRAAAGEALIRIGHLSARKLVTDGDADVRLRVTVALVQYSKDKSAMPNLIALLGELPPSKAWPIEDILNRLAGDDAPSEPLGNDETTRHRCRDAWSAWWKKNGGAVDLAKLDQAPASLGLTVVVQADGTGRVVTGSVYEVNMEKVEQWRIKDLSQPQDTVVVGPDRVWIAEAGNPQQPQNPQGQVSLRDFKGKVIWQSPIQYPMSLQALPHGHILVAARNQVIELDEKYKTVFTWQREQAYDILTAAKQRNGDYVVLTNSECIRIRTDRKTPSFPIAPGSSNSAFAGMDVLSNGRILLTQPVGVAEFDTDGHRGWALQKPAQPTSVQRLANGNTLVTAPNERSVLEFDSRGEKVWEYHPDAGIPRRAHRR
ncbi:MAG: HEAT repeat domain-containing protein [Gemmataceae bacterium]